MNIEPSKKLSKHPIKIAVVEDSDDEFSLILYMLNKFFAEASQPVEIKHYSDALGFLQEYQRDTEIILLDIQLGEDNGIDIAKRIREIDEDVIIIFCTKLAQYAVTGYQVNALDFIVKPFTYEYFSFRLKRALDALDKKNKSSNLMIKTKSGIKKLGLDDILYLDVFGHSLGFHTTSGTLYSWGSLAKYELELNKNGFFRCSNSSLVNSSHIDTIKGKEIVLDNGEILNISRPRHKSFMISLSRWAGITGK